MTEFIGKKISNNEYLYTNNGFKKTGLPNPDGTITGFIPTFDSVSAIPTGFVGTARVGTTLYVGDGINIITSNTIPSFATYSAIPSNFVGACRVGTTLYVGDGINIITSNTIPSFATYSTIPSNFVGACRVGTDLYVGDGTTIVKSSSTFTMPVMPSIRPSLNLDFVNSKQVDSRITFTRNSTATYYDGKTTALAEQNLLLQSQAFATTWVTSNTTLGSVTTAPDGTATAYPLTASAINGTLLQTFTATANAYTFSIYIQRVTGTGNIDITVDGTTYTTQTTTGTWTRFNITTTPSAGSKTAGIRLAVSGDVVNIWGAQLEQRSSATAYTPTSNQNLLTYSQDYTNTAWTKTNSTVGTLTYTDPLGTTTAQKIVDNSTNGLHGVSFDTGLMPAGSTYTYSVHLKAGERLYASVYLYDGTNFNQAWFNLSTGAVISTDGTVGTITSIGSGWYRCSLSIAITIAITPYGGVLALNTPTYTAPTELVTNGTFTTDTTGWLAPYQSSISSVNGMLRITATGSNPYAQQIITNLVIGKTYVIKINGVTSPPIGTTWSLFLGNATGLAQAQYVSTLSLVNNSRSVVFTATTNILNIQIVGALVTVGDFADIDNISVKEISGQYVGDGTSGIYIWGSQLEYGSTATYYSYKLTNTSYPITNYIPQLMTAPVNSPRIDYNPISGKCQGLLLEESRANLYIGNGGRTSSGPWINNVTTTPSPLPAQGIAPDGTQTAWLIPSGATGRVQTNITTPSDTLTYTCSFYAKSLSGTDIIYSATVGFNSGTNFGFNQVIYNFSTNATGAGWLVTPIGNNWVRLSYSVVNTSLTTFILSLYSNISGNASTGTTLFWGAQLEAGSFTTSYIPTSTAAVTRAADQASLTGTNFSSWYNQGQGAFYMQANEYNFGSGNWWFLYASDNSATNYLGISNYNNGLYCIVQNNGASYSPALSGNIASGVDFKAMISYGGVANRGGLNGLSTTAASNVIPATTMTRLDIGSQTNGSGRIGGHIRKLSYYPVALSSEELQGLTTL